MALGSPGAIIAVTSNVLGPPPGTVMEMTPVDGKSLAIEPMPLPVTRMLMLPNAAGAGAATASLVKKRNTRSMIGVTVSYSGGARVIMTVASPARDLIRHPQRVATSRQA